MKWSRLLSFLLVLFFALSLNLPIAMAQQEEEYVDEGEDKPWHIIPGFKLGYYAVSIDSDELGGADFTGFAMAPSIDVWYNKFGFGFTLLYAPSVSSDEFDESVTRIDLDTIFKFRFNKYLQAFTGLRYENNIEDEYDYSYSVFLIPVLGGAFTYPMDFGLTPYVVASFFPYASLEGDQDDWSETGWGIGSEFGVAYSFTFPLTLSFGYKIQYLSFDSFEETIHYVSGGAFYNF